MSEMNETEERAHGRAPEGWSLARRGLALLLAAAALAVGCGGADDASSTTTAAAPTTEAPTTTTAPASVTTAPVVPNMKPDEVAIRNTLDEFLAVMTRIYEDPDPADPALNAFVASPFKEHILGLLGEYRREGRYFRRTSAGLPKYQTLEVRIAGDSAIATDCLIDDRFDYLRGSDQPVDTTVGRYSYENTLIRGEAGRWLLSDVAKRSAGVTAQACSGL